MSSYFADSRPSSIAERKERLSGRGAGRDKRGFVSGRPQSAMCACVCLCVCVRYDDPLNRQFSRDRQDKGVRLVNFVHTTEKE